VRARALLQEPAVRPLIDTPGYDRNRALRCNVYRDQGAPATLADLGQVSDVLAQPENFVWLDIAQPSPGDFEMLQREFDIHPMAIEDATLWHERPTIEFFDDYVLVIAHAVTLDGNGELITHEIAVLAGANYVITLRAFPIYPLDEIDRRRRTSITAPRDATGLVYIILDTIVDGYFPVTERYDARLIKLESRLFDNDETLNERTEHEIFRFKRALVLFRSIVTPMREVLSRLTHSSIAPLKPGLGPYFRDVHDHVLRALEQIDITRELVNSTLDTHLATQSHRQNEVSKQLTVIATIFLPLTYITGFFGQNFGWMINGLGSPEVFWYLGVGSQLLTLVVLFWYFRRRRWF
jgi:magnesium transporter